MERRGNPPFFSIVFFNPDHLAYPGHGLNLVVIQGVSIAYYSYDGAVGEL